METLTLPQIITAILLSSVSINTWFVKRELSGLRRDSKEERDKRGELETEIATIKATCAERHKTK